MVIDRWFTEGKIEITDAMYIEWKREREEFSKWLLLRTTIKAYSRMTSTVVQQVYLLRINDESLGLATLAEFVVLYVHVAMVEVVAP